MDWDADVIVLGGGAAGAFAAAGFEGSGLRVLVLDYGNTPAGPNPDAASLDALKGTPAGPETLVGPEFETLHNLFHAELTPKLRGPRMRYVVADTERHRWEEAGPFRPVSSLAKGGLANAWGAQVYRFDARDLAAFPVGAADLAPHYDAVSREIGVSGSSDDDLAPFHGAEPELQPPTRSTPLAEALLAGYRKKREAFARDGFALGKPRLAVLTREHRGRAPLRYDNLEFFLPGSPAYYSPAFTLRRLEAAGAVAYAGGWFAETHEEDEEGVTIAARHGATGERRSFRARRLVLALGCLQTARFVLGSAGDIVSRLPVLENPMTFLPVLNPRFVGSAPAVPGYSSDLALRWEGAADGLPRVGMVYHLGGLLRSDFLAEIPLPLREARTAARLLLPAMMAVQLYYPMGPSAACTMGLRADGTASFAFTQAHDWTMERRLVPLLRKAGFLTHLKVAKLCAPGASLHYAGTLPMRAAPMRPYETGPDGLLFGSRRVHVADAAAFPFLPAKNLTFTIMANALRVGRIVAERGST